MSQEPGDGGTASVTRPLLRRRRAAVLTGAVSVAPRTGAGTSTTSHDPGLLAVIERAHPEHARAEPYLPVPLTAVGAGGVVLLGPTRPAVPAPREPAGPLVAVGTALTVLGLGALALVFCLLLVSQLSYARAQNIAFDNFRNDLSKGTVPVGQTIIEVPEEVVPVAGAEPEPVTEPELPQQLRVAPGTPIALMSIPVLEIDREVVLEGTSGSVLQRGPGHQRNSSFPGQPGGTSIFGRAASFGGVFGDIDTLVRGDEIRFTTGQLQTDDGTFEEAAEIVYEVTTVRRENDKIQLPDPEIPRLTLITADGAPYLPDGALYVDAVLVTEPQPAAFRQINELPEAEGLLARDPDAWVPVMLWSQGLLLAAIGLTWLRFRWGRMQAWLVGTPVIALLAVGLTSSSSLLLPNLL